MLQEQLHVLAGLEEWAASCFLFPGMLVDVLDEDVGMLNDLVAEQAPPNGFVAAWVSGVGFEDHVVLPIVDGPL